MVRPQLYVPDFEDIRADYSIDTFLPLIFIFATAGNSSGNCVEDPLPDPAVLMALKACRVRLSYDDRVAVGQNEGERSLLEDIR